MIFSKKDLFDFENRCMLFKRKEWVVVAHTCNPNTSLGKLRWENCGELEASLGYGTTPPQNIHTPLIIWLESAHFAHTKNNFSARIPSPKSLTAVLEQNPPLQSVCVCLATGTQSSQGFGGCFPLRQNKQEGEGTHPKPQRRNRRE